MPATDLTSLDGLDWAPAARRATLDAVRDHAVSYAQGKEKWYSDKRPSRRTAGLMTRISILVLTSLAGLLPLLTQLESSIDPIWASVALVLAGALAGIDRFFGLSRSWTRYMASETLIAQRRNQFHFDWNELALDLDANPTESEARKLLALAKTFVLDVDAVVAKETGEWVADVGAGTETQLPTGPNR